MNTLDIKREIVQNITTTDVLKSVLKDKYKQPLQKINYMVKIGDLISLKRGVYVFSEKYRIKDLNYILIANILHKPSYVSFEYALSYYGLIPERVYTITSATSSKSVKYSTALGNFSYKRIPLKAYSLGVDWKYDNQDGGHFIATAEKALCDKIFLDKRAKNLKEDEILEYLEEDLRIEHDELLKLDSKLFWHISMAYGSRVLLNVAKVLKGFKMANLHPHIEAMLSRYDLNKDEPFEALREVLQEIVLYALYETGFFNYAAFYGGTALRILYKLPRFSEDLDFSLLEPDSSFDLSKYEKTILSYLNNYGFECSIDTKIKTNSDIQSAFLKTNTIKQLISINAPKDIVAKYPPTKQLKIKLEVDTNPPLDFEVEEKLHLVPLPFQIKTMKTSSLFAGKLHAILCRGWKTRPKGRDWYDLVWYVKNSYEVDMNHLKARLKQSCKAFNNEIKDFSQSSIMELLNKRIEDLDVSMAKDDVSRFIHNQRELELWSKEFFKTIISMIKVKPDKEWVR